MPLALACVFTSRANATTVSYIHKRNAVRWQWQLVIVETTPAVHRLAADRPLVVVNASSSAVKSHSLRVRHTPRSMRSANGRAVDGGNRLGRRVANGPTANARCSRSVSNTGGPERKRLELLSRSKFDFDANRRVFFRLRREETAARARSTRVHARRILEPFKRPLID